jgi:hypothetical protein
MTISYNLVMSPIQLVALFIYNKRISQVTNYIRKKTHILFMIFVFVSNSGVQHVLIISVTWRVSSKKQELLILREHINSPQFFVLNVKCMFM